MAGRRDTGARGLLFALILLIALAFTIDLFRSNSLTRDLFATKSQPRPSVVDLLRANRPR